MFPGLSNHIERTIVSIRRAIHEMEEQLLYEGDSSLKHKKHLKRAIATKSQQLKAYRRQAKTLH